MSTEFTNHITFGTFAFNRDSGEDLIKTTFVRVDDWQNFNMNASVVSFPSVNINLDNIATGKIATNVTGKFFFQFIFALQGGAEVYEYQVLKNDVVLEYASTQFTTRGSGVSWEVASTFIVDLGYNNIAMSNSFGSSINEIQLQVKNTGSTGFLALDNMILNIMRID